MGKIIVIEGLDGCGKSTQFALAAAELSRAGHCVRTLKFPRYESEGSALVRGYLAGHFGSTPDEVNCYAASSFYASDRYISYVNEWRADYEAGAVFLFDRYVSSNAIFQTPKLPTDEWEGYLDWLYDYEFSRLKIPAPDAVIFLDMSAELSEKLMCARYGGDEGKKDIHEKSPEYQQRCLDAARFCAKHGGWLTIRCDREGELRTIEDIHAEIMALVRGIL